MTRNTGAFVYTGAGKKQSEDADPCVKACRKIACQIQYCMAKNNHMQSKCEALAKSWDECCEQVRRSESKRGE